MKIKAILKAIGSKPDMYGNSYWAFTFTDCKTGKVVSANISGGESNIRSITIGFTKEHEWDRSIHLESVELPIREFNRLTKSWPYAGCDPKSLAQFIKKSLK